MPYGIDHAQWGGNSFGWNIVSKSLKPSFCKKRPKIVLDQLLVWGVRTLWSLNGTKMNLDDHGNNLNLFRISLESFRFFRGHLLTPQTINWSGNVFAVSYSKLALIRTYIGHIFLVFSSPLSIILNFFLIFFFCRSLFIFFHQFSSSCVQNTLGCKIFGFFSSRFLKTKGFCSVSFAQFVYFLREVCYNIIVFLCVNFSTFEQ